MPKVCPVCDTTFEGKRSYVKHVNISHKQFAKDYWKPCSICHPPKYFPDMREVEIHVNSIHAKACHQCPLCPQRFDSKELLIEHFEWQHPEYDSAALKNSDDQRLKFMCKLCEAKLNTEIGLFTHIRSQHKDYVRKNWRKCPNCPAAKHFPNQQSLRKHILEKHQQPAGNNITVINEGPSGQLHASQQLSKAPEKKEIYIKESRMFKEDEVFKKLLVRRESNEPKPMGILVCPHCGAKCAQLSNMKLHMTAKHLENLEKDWAKCPICKDRDDYFPSDTALDSHLTTIHKNLAYKCPVCQIQRRSRFKMLEHIHVKHRNQEMTALSLNEYQKPESETIAEIPARMTIDHEFLKDGSAVDNSAGNLIISSTMSISTNSMFAPIQPKPTVTGQQQGLIVAPNVPAKIVLPPANLLPSGSAPVLLANPGPNNTIIFSMGNPNDINNKNRVVQMNVEPDGTKKLPLPDDLKNVGNANADQLKSIMVIRSFNPPGSDQLKFTSPKMPLPKLPSTTTTTKKEEKRGRKRKNVFWQCEVCDNELPSKAGLQEHMLSQHNIKSEANSPPAFVDDDVVSEDVPMEPEVRIKEETGSESQETTIDQAQPEVGPNDDPLSV